MEIKKFEAYKYGYKGKGLDSNRAEFLSEFWDILVDENILGYEIVSSMYEKNNETVYLFLDKEVNGKYENTGGPMKVIKLDFSDVGIEFGEMSWNDDKEDWNEFVLLKNLDTEVTKQVKSYKKDITKYNV